MIWPLPHIGQRIIKTTVAVYLCFLICYLRELLGQDMSAEAAITAIICMQPYVKDSKNYAVDRFTGTMLGSVWGLLFLVLMAAFPILGRNTFLLYALMAAGVMLALYSAVLVRKPDTSSLAAIVFVCIVIAYPHIEEPLVQAANRFIDVLVGTCVAIAVNVFRLPRTKNLGRVYFVRTKDLVPDRFSQIAPAVMFRLNYLFGDGAKICLISEHAPAFFVSQMSMVRVTTPLVVMDGAAVYDMNENKYLYTQPIPQEVSAALLARLEQLGIGCFIYTVHRNRTCIFHKGQMTEQEKDMYETMRRSPYRYYLDGEVCNPDEIVYVKILTTEEKIIELLSDLNRTGKEYFSSLRPVVRNQRGDARHKALYLYSMDSSQERAKKFVMDLLSEETPGLTQQELKLNAPYRSERDALYLLHKVEESFEPVRRPIKGLAKGTDHRPGL